MLEMTEEMKTIDDYLTAIDGERWSENSATELTHLLSNAATFTSLEECDGEMPTNLKVVDVGGKLVGLIVFTVSNN
jgi:hypothetical protein